MSKIKPLIPLIFVLLWSTGFVGAKYAMPYADPFWFLAIRCLITIALLGVLIAILRSAVFFSRDGLKQILIGMMIHGGYLGGVFFAISHGMPAGITAVIVGIQPLMTAFIASLFGADILRPRGWIGLGLGALAIIMVVLDTHGFGVEGASIMGSASAIFALFSISAGTVLQKKWGQGLPFLSSTVYQYCGAIMVFLAASFAIETQEIAWVPPLILSLIWLVVGLSIGAILLLLFMIKEGQVAKVASYFYLVPPVVMIESYVLFGEKIGALGAIGAVLALSAVVLVNSK